MKAASVEPDDDPCVGKEEVRLLEGTDVGVSVMVQKFVLGDTNAMDISIERGRDNVASRLSSRSAYSYASSTQPSHTIVAW